MSILVTHHTEITVQNTITLGPGNTGRVIDSAKRRRLQLGAASTPAVSQYSSFAKALVAGAGQIDLTALPAVAGVTPTYAGLAVRMIRVANPNDYALVVTPAVTNGYDLTFTVPPQGVVQIECDSGLADIDATHKLLDLAGDTTNSANWFIVLG